MKPPPAYLDAAEVARRLCVAERTAYAIMHSIEHHRVGIGGRSIRVTEKAFAAYVEATTCAPDLDSTAAGVRGGARTTTSRAHATGSRRAARTAAPPKPSPLNSNGLPLIRPVQPRTKPRSPSASNDC